MSARMDAALAEVVGAAHVLTDAERCAPFEVDWTRRFRGRARCVVRPADTAEVAAVAAICAGARTPMVLQGGNTGLVGGGVPRDGEVLVSLTRLDQLGAVDPITAQVTVGAGVPLAALQAHARAADLAFGVDLAARDSATVGGMVATNAGGIRVIRHGPMRAQVVDLQAVTSTGAVIGGVRGLEKDNTGYHLPSLLTGSEGTLAIVTGARLRLVPRDRHRVVALVALADVRAAVTLAGRLRRSLMSLSAAELILPDGLELVMSVTGMPPPFPEPPGAALLVECGGGTDPAPELAAILDDAGEVRAVSAGVEATDLRRLWAYRERHTEAISTLGVPHKLDVSVAPADVPELLDRTREVLGRIAPGSRLVAFGHVAEGNLHLNVLGPGPNDLAVDDALFALVHELGGSISAEHGIGRAKAAWMDRVHSPAHLQALRQIKRAFDPEGLLNPGVLVDP